MTKWSSVSVLSLIMALASTHAADISIVKSGAPKTPIDISGIIASGGQNAATFKLALENDLVKSGWFVIASPGRGAVVVSGPCQDSGRSISFSCAVKNTSGGVFLSKAYDDNVNRARSLAHVVSDDIVMAVKKVKGIASMRIALIGKRSGSKDLYMCDYDGGNLRSLTSFRTICMAPYWAPDGSAVTYTSFKSGFPEVYKIDVSARTHQKMSHYPGLSTGGAISPDGSSMALILSKDGNPELYVLNMRSSRLTRLTVTRSVVESSPVWSPDGKEIAFVSNKARTPQIYTMSRGGGMEKRMSFVGSENVAPDWGPDGRLTWCSRRGGNYQIVVRQTGGDEVQISKESADFEDPSWAPDGRHVVCSKRSGYQGGAGIYMLDTLGDPPVCLTNIAGDWLSPACSP